LRQDNGGCIIFTLRRIVPFGSIILVVISVSYFTHYNNKTLPVVKELEHTSQMTSDKVVVDGDPDKKTKGAYRYTAAN